MADREKVLKGLECCLVLFDDDMIYQCDECPYRATEDERKVIDWRCHLEELRSDALELLKGQEPRLLTIEEITGDGECWFEGINGACGYADCYMCTGSKEVELHRISMKPEYVSWDDFGKKWRCWSYRPTDEQRKAVKWDVVQ